MARNLATGRLEFPKGVDKLKYSRMYRAFEARCRRSGVETDLIDFDEEVYDNKLSDHEILDRIDHFCQLSHVQEAIVGVPEREYRKLQRQAESCSVALSRLKSKSKRPRCRDPRRARREKWCNTYIMGCGPEKKRGK